MRAVRWYKLDYVIVHVLLRWKYFFTRFDYGNLTKTKWLLLGSFLLQSIILGVYV